jgi:type II secretion system protein G
MEVEPRARKGEAMLKTIITIALGILLASAIIGVVILILYRQGDSEANREAERVAKIETTKALLVEVESAMELYKVHIGHYPTEEEGGLNALHTKPTFDNPQVADKWRGPYLKKEPKDAWENPISYELLDSSEHPPYHLWSKGPSGFGGAEEIRSYHEAQL